MKGKILRVRVAVECLACGRVFWMTGPEATCPCGVEMGQDDLLPPDEPCSAKNQPDKEERDEVATLDVAAESCGAEESAPQGLPQADDDIHPNRGEADEASPDGDPEVGFESAAGLLEDE